MDHRVLNRDLEFFAFDENIGAGLPLWLPNGAAVREELEKWLKELEHEAGFQRVASPHLAVEDLYVESGHLPYYEESMFPVMKDGEDGRRLRLRPMNCPHHHRIFAHRPRSYRELPLRLAEFGQVYRWERSGSLLGLQRVRGLCQNDAHIYCAREQAEDEIRAVLAMHRHVYDVLGLKVRYRLSLHDAEDPRRAEKYVADPEGWEWSENLLRRVLAVENVDSDEAKGEAAFYAPKIDVQAVSSMGREESIASIQLDFGMAAKIGLRFAGADGEFHAPVIVHRAPLGSFERIVSYLMEHYEGKFPPWLAPVQAEILPLGAAQEPLAADLELRARRRGFRMKFEAASASLSDRLKEAYRRKVPFAWILGKREAEAGVVLRKDLRGGREEVLSEDALFAELAAAVAKKEF